MSFHQWVAGLSLRDRVGLGECVCVFRHEDFTLILIAMMVINKSDAGLINIIKI